MQVEPPGPDLSDHQYQPVGALRLSAALGAAALAVGSSGHLFVLGGLLALVAMTRLGAATALLASTAVLVRWGAPTLSATAGGQAVLGPAAAVGTTAAAASAVLAALAIALLTPPVRRERGPARTWHLVTVGCIGLVVGAIAAGPTLPLDIGVRLAGAVVGVTAALGASLLPTRRLVATGAFGSAALAVLFAAVG